jgi:hypothetical protein
MAAVPWMHRTIRRRIFGIMHGIVGSLVLASVLLGNTNASIPMVYPKQGLIDLLLEYMEVRYPEQELGGDLLYVSVQRQRLYHVRAGALLADYPIATASKGLGAKVDSYCTPTGLHRVSEKFGDGVPPLGILKDREFTGEIADTDFAGVDKDWIT